MKNFKFLKIVLIVLSMVFFTCSESDDRGNIVGQDGDGFTVLEDPDDTDPNVPVNQG